MSEGIFVRCVECNTEFTETQVPDGTISCVQCGTQALPSFIEDDVTIKINWHELKILGQAAERWAEYIQKNGSSHSVDSQRVINAICGRLMAQFPHREPLTLSAEIASLRQEYGEVEVVGFTEDEEANDDER